ncbi:MAG TPA: DUF4214 domain-containing protein [Bryobacteraceae bacterium]|nr:DUF4214 domain-containing protein [Bryobacteraceae bacterium]
MCKNFCIFLLAAAAPIFAGGPTVNQAKLPLYFEANQGQTNPAVRYLSRTPSGLVFLTDSETVWRRGDSVLRLRFAGASKPRAWREEGKSGGISSYFSRERTVTAVPHFSRVRAEELYKGIGVSWYGNGKELEYDFEVAAGADPSQIRLSFEGKSGVKIDRAGDLLVATGFGELRMKRPIAFQGNKEIACNYRLGHDGSVLFALGHYDRSRPLVIDPVVASLSYSTLLGGAGRDFGYGGTVDTQGNAYIVGATTSTDFPLSGQGTRSGTDAYVAKLNATGTAVLFAVYLAGSAEDNARQVAFDDAGNVYVSGETKSPNLPVTAAAQPAWGGDADGFLAKFNSSGTALVYLTYIGGAGEENANALAVNRASGEAFVGGATKSGNFPTTAPMKATLTGQVEGYVAKYGPTGTRLFATYWGGAGLQPGNVHSGVSVTSLVLDSAGNPAFVGTGGAALPISAGAAIPSSTANSTRGYVAKLSADGQTVLVCTYTSDPLVPNSLAMDSSNRFFIAGNYSGQVNDIFYAVLSATGTAYSAVSNISASGDDQVTGVALGGAEPMLYITGVTTSQNFPTSASFGGLGADDAYLLKLNMATNRREYVVRIGGPGEDVSHAVAVGPTGLPYIFGYTNSAAYPTTPGAIRTTGADFEGVVTKFDEAGCATTLAPSSLQALPTGAAQTITITSNCLWNATSNSAWITFTSPTAGNNNGTIGISVAPNGTGVARTGSVTIAGANFTVTQEPAACSFTFAPVSQAAPATGGSFSFAVTASQSYCQWTPSTASSFLTPASTAPVTGNGTVNYTVAINVGPARAGTITVGGQSFTVTQAAPAGCLVALNQQSASIPGSGALHPVPLTASAPDCPVAVVSNIPWIKVFSRDTSVILTVDTNNTNAARSGAVTVAGQTYTINQAAEPCTFALNTNSVGAGFNGNLQGQAVTLTASGTGCAWVTSSPVFWAKVAPQTGTGSANITITIVPNFSTQTRTTTVSVAGQPFTITQTPSGEPEQNRFVRLLYFSFFGRVAGDDEVQLQVNSLNIGQQTRAQMVTAFLDTPEFNEYARFVAGLYIGLFGRNADYDGWQFQRNAIAKGIVSKFQVVENFLTSGEYAGKFGSPNNDDFVRLLYRYILRREPSNAEVAFHVGSLNPPSFTRTNMATNFLNSNEFRTGTDSQLLSFIISAALQLRDPSIGEMNARTAALNGGTPMVTLIDAVFGTPSFQALLN